MVIRIVKLEFQTDKIETFLEFFENVKFQVNGFPGCRGMQLHQSQSNPALVFTYSIWDCEDDLEKYRLSETFSKIWPEIKVWFAAKPEAWTLKNHFDGLNLFN